jgi:tetraacyldisaccharide 4'-kinase
MHINGNSLIHGLKTSILNTLSLMFKTVSLLNLKRKARNKKIYQDAFIISIDNLAFGGTGKTPLVLAIGEHLEEQGIDFAIVTRGYKSTFETLKESTKVEPHHTCNQVGDEAALFKRHFPNQTVYVGRHRQNAIKKALAAGIKFILLDDGFQSTHIHKNIKIMLLNLNHPYYYLRNFKFLCKDEDILLYLLLRPEWDQKDQVPAKEMELHPRIQGNYFFQLTGFYDIQDNKVEPQGAAVTGFSAVGDNNRFKADLEAEKDIKLLDFKSFEDHFDYSQKHLEALDQWRKDQHADYLVCTEKDIIKILPHKLHHIPFLYVRNSIKFNFNLMSRILSYAKTENFI